MVSAVTLGNFFSSGSRTVFGGAGGSGLDTASIIKALVDAKSIPATQAQDKIKVNDTQAGALSEFQTLLSKLKDAANFLRNPPGVNNQADNIFKYTTASVTSNTTVTGATYVAVSTSPGATPQSYTIDEISSLAKSQKQSTGSFAIASADAAVVSNTPIAGQFKAGTFTFKGVSITLSDGDTLNNVAARFNTVSNQTGVTANIIKVDDTHFQLSFVATQSGTDHTFNFNGADLTDPGDVFDLVPAITTTQTAANAVFKLNGVQITRSTNNVGDAVSGVTFTLFQTTPALTTLTVDVKRDNALIKDGVVNFVNAYNEFKTFVAKQTEVDDNGRYVSTALLASNATFRQVSNDIVSQVTGIASRMVLAASGGSLAKSAINFSDLPRSADSPEVRNVLAVDEGTLTSIISTDPDEVREAFTFDFQTTNAALQVFSRTNALRVNSFSLLANPYAAQVTQTLTIASQTTSVMTVADADTAFVVASPAAGQIGAGTITINGQTVTLVAGDTLNQVIAKFAAVQAGSGVTATLNNLGGGTFTISFSGNNTNLNTLDTNGLFAQVDVSSANTAFVQTTAGPGELKAGAITINGQTITLAHGDTLNQVITKFNTVAASSGLTATLNTGAFGQYTISFASTVVSGQSNQFNLKASNLDTNGLFSQVGVTATGSYSATYTLGGVVSTVNLSAQTVTGGSVILSGPSGSGIEGLRLLYSSSAASSSTATVTQGFGDKVYNAASASLTQNTGTIAIELESIKLRNDRLEFQIAQINEQVERFRQQLLEKFGALEQAIARVNNLLQSITANTDARNNN